METKMTIRLLAGAVLALTATAALDFGAVPARADTAGPAPKPNARGPATISGFFSPFPFQGGEAIYKGVCQGCHMPDAKGAVGAGAYPALAKNENLETAAYPVSIVLKGQKAMPFFGMQLNDQQIADVVNYVRTHFGNKYKDKVKPEDVKALR
jgi:cytochrome c5